MSLSNFSIKSRLLVLCLVPTVVIIGFAVNSVIRIQEQLHSYTVIDEKARTLNLLSVLSGHIYQGVTKRVEGLPSQTSVSLATETIKRIEKVSHVQGHNHHSGEYNPQTLQHLEEIKELLPELNNASPQGTVEIARLMYEILYDIYFDIQKIESHDANVAIHKLDLVLSDLSWLYYWMEREAWLARELNVLGWDYSDFAPQYFRINERQQFYLDKYITKVPVPIRLKNCLRCFLVEIFAVVAI
ncbi:hypothetical protein [Vibrio sonorensis]|uniref:hypothetical protein n=1 Tax=Vibrio sonorensis TaxID=1004316 RepID=UPI000AA6F34E